MGRRGPKPQPAAIRQQKAAVRSRQANRGAQVVESAPGSALPPKWLKGEGLRIWNRLAATLRAAKLLTDADAQTFARYCRNFARWLDMQHRLDKSGEIYEIETASGMVRRADPAFLIGDRLERMMLAVEDRFGLNPAERQRIFAARSQTGVSGDLFSQAKDERRSDDPAADPSQPTQPIESPVGLLN